MNDSTIQKAMWVFAGDRSSGLKGRQFACHGVGPDGVGLTETEEVDYELRCVNAIASISTRRSSRQTSATT